MFGSYGSLILGILFVLAVCILPVQAADNPVPKITKISPTYTDAGVSTVTITVTGSNFITMSVVQWDGIDKPTTYASATKLTVKIPGDDLKYAKTARIRVYNPAPGGGYSNEVTFTVKPAYWIKSIWPAVVELDPVTLQIKGPNSYWEVNKQNADPLADYIFGLGVTGPAANPQVYFIDAQTKFPSSSTKNSIWQLDMGTGKSTKVLALTKFAKGLAAPSPTKANLHYYAEGKNVHVLENGNIIQTKALPENIGGIDVVDGSSPFLLAIAGDPGKQSVYRAYLDSSGRYSSDWSKHIGIKATPTSILYPYGYTGIAFATVRLGGVDRQVLYVTKDDGTIEPWDTIGIIDFTTGDIIAASSTDDLGIEVDPSTAWQSGTSGYLNYANPSGIDFVDGRLFVSSLHYWNKGDKWPPIPEKRCINGKKWEDTNGDGIWDIGEKALQGWTFHLLKNVGDDNWMEIATTTTDQNGAYKFCNLPPCTWYKVTETVNDGYVQTFPKNPDYYKVYLYPCSCNPPLNFGNKPVPNGKIIIVKEGTGCMRLPSGMVGWWPGDGNSLDMIDGNPGSPATYASGKVGQAFSLDGVDDAVQISEAGSNLDGFGKLTLDAWVKPDTLAPEYQTIVSKYDASQNNGVSYWLGLRKDGRIQFSVYSTSTANPVSSTGWTAITTAQGLVPTDRFTHVSGVWDGGQNLIIYVDGGAQAAPVTPNGLGPGGASTADNTAPVTIGAVWREGPGSTAPGLLFQGLIDEVEIFQTALTQTEIQAIFGGGKCKGIFHYEAGDAPLAPFNMAVGDYRSFDPFPAGTYTVTETLPLPDGWLFKSLSCDDIDDPLTLVSGTTASIHLDGGETVTCTYVNEKEKGKIVIVKDGSAESCEAAPSGMVGWWQGENNPNDHVDGNNGAPVGDATYAAGKVGQAFSLDGNGDAVTISEAGTPLDGFDELTLDAWVKPTAIGPDLQTIVAKYSYPTDHGVSYWLGFLPDGKIRFAVYTDSKADGSFSGYYTDTKIPAETTTDFTHIAGVWDGSPTLHIYVNGADVPVDLFAPGSPGTTVDANTVPVSIGRVENIQGQPGFYFPGLIDEVEIFSRALSQTEIQKIVTADDDGKCDTLFPYTADPIDDFTLPLGGQIVFDQLNAGTYTVKETPVPDDWLFKKLTCSDPDTGISGAEATIHLDAGETVTCTYTNEEENRGTIIIEKEGTGCLVPPGDMVGWWPGDSSTDDLADDNPAELKNGATYASGRVADAFSLDGVDDGVEIAETNANLDGFSELTIDAWIYVDKAFSPQDNRRAIVAKYDSQHATDPSYAFMVDGGKLQLMVFDTVGGPDAFWAFMTNDVVIQPQTWYHVAATWKNPTTFAIYVDGASKAGALTTVGTPVNMRDSTVPVDIGRVRRTFPTIGFQGFFTGKIDEVEIFDRALTQPVIEDIASEGGNGKCKPIFPFAVDKKPPLDDFTLPIGGQMIFNQIDAGTYTVQETPVPANWKLTKLECVDPDDETTIDSTTGTATIDLDAGETVTCTYTNEKEACEGKICGYKYVDVNGDGQMDPGDTPLDGVKIRLYPGTATPVDSVDIGLASSEVGHNLAGWGLVEPANSGGTYGGIANTRVTWTPDTPGDARSASFTLAVADTTKDHFMRMKVLDGIADDSFIVLANGNPVYTFAGKNNPIAGGQNYFGDPAGSAELWRTHGIFLAKEILSVGDNTVTVIATGQQWSGFDPYGQLAVDTVELLKLDAPIAEVTTDSNGHYCFENLDKGDYYVGEAAIPSGNVPSTHSILSKVTLTCNQVVEPLDFFNTGSLKICGEKFFDENGNGLGDPDTGLGGVEMTLFTRSAAPADSVDVGAGDASETSHGIGTGVNGWGPIEPLTSGGTWGGIDDARATWVTGDGRGASFTLDAGTGTQHELVLRVLDGQADDSFVVTVNGNPVYQYTAKNSPLPGSGNYFGDPSGPEELWRDHRIYVAGTGTLTISVAAMGDAWSGFDTYGQLGVDRADLYTLTPVSGANPVSTASDGKFCILLTGVDLSNLPVYYIGETGLPSGSIPTTGSVNDPASQPYIFRNTEMGDVSKLFDLLIDEYCPPGELGDYTTYTQGGWGAPPHGQNPGQLLADHFAAVYPAGVKIGKSGGFQLVFTSSNAVKDFLPAGGTPSVLTGSTTDPTTSAAGVFAGQVLTLQLNVDFSDESITDPDLGDLIYVKAGDSLDGKTIQEILDIANDVLGGGTLPAGHTVPTLNDLIDHLNKAFDNGNTSGWANQYLKEENGACISPLPVGAVLKVDLTRDSTTVTKDLVEGAGGHWTYEFTGLEPGCYDYRVYYVLGMQEVTLFQGTECIPVSITNSFTWEGCHALIGIEKIGPVMGRPGDTITYTYDVTNLAEEPLANVGISDDLASNEQPVEIGGFNVGDTNTDDLLDPGEFWKFEAEYTLPAFDPYNDGLTNIVTATGSACGGAVTAQDDYTLFPFILRKDVLLYWEGDSVDYPLEPGMKDPTIFPFTVSRDGQLLTPTPLQVSESSPVAFWLAEGLYDFDEVNVPAGYEAAYDTGVTVSIPMDWPDFGLLNIIHYDLAITKSAPDGCIYPGTDVTYTYTVTNKGLASVAPEVKDTIHTIPEITNPVTSYTGDTDSDGLVDPGETWTFTLTVPLPIKTPPGTVPDTATVTEPHADDDDWWKGGDSNPADNTDTDSIQVCWPEIGICGTKFSDDDGNGQQGAGELGVENVQMKLFTIGALSDRVEIGDLASEGTHDMQDWGPIEPDTHGGGWGSIAPGTLRTTWVPANAPWASFKIDAGGATSSLLKIRALDGGSDDSFLVEVDGQPVYVYKADPSPTEAWYVHDIYVPGSGILTVKITAIGEAGPWFDPYGQLGVDWAEIYPLTATSYQTTTGSNGGYCFSITDLNPFQNPATFYIGEIAPQGRTPSTDSVLGPLTITQDPQSWQFTGKNFGNRLLSLLRVTKVMKNDNGGTKTPVDFTFTINGGTPQQFEADGENEYPYFVGSFTILEPPVAGYTPGYTGCTDSVTPGETKTCTITNDDEAPTITLVKVVDNGNGGNAGVNDFGLTIGGTPVNSGQVLPVQANTPIALNEVGLSGYAFVSMTGTDCPAVLGGTVTLDEGQDLTCTVTNNDIAPQLTVIKHVINDDGGGLDADEFMMTVTGTDVQPSGTFPGAESPGTTVTMDAGPFGVDEAFVAFYTKSTSGDCSGTMALGDVKTCTITNDDVDVVGTGILGKTATADITTTYTWSIEKTSQTSQITLDPGESASVDYQVTLVPTPHTATTVTGTVTIQNPLGSAISIGSLTDVLKPGDIPVTLACSIDGNPVSIPTSLPAGKTLLCTYTKNLQGNPPTSNQATATMEGDPYTVTVPVATGTTTEVDECVTVTDDKGGPQGQVCADDLDKTIEYSLTIGPYMDCGDYEFVNTASFVTGDSCDTDSDSWTVDVEVPCPQNPVVEVCVVDCDGAPLPDATVKYAGCAELFGTTGPDGCVEKEFPVGTTDLEVWAEYALSASSHVTQDITIDPTFEFQTDCIDFRLETCDPTGLEGGKVRYGREGTYTTRWVTGQTDSDGNLRTNLFPGEFSFEMQYKSTVQQKLNQILPGASPLVWTTTAVTLNHANAISYSGASGDNTWFTKPTMELLPGTNRVHFRDPGGGTTDLTWSGCTYEYTWT